jgi:DNA-binding response OmpR family regulator/HAMP domain-containing protein
VRLHSELAAATYVLKNSEQTVDMKIRLMAISEGFAGSMEKGDFQAARNRLAILALENDLDFLSLTDDKGRTVVRASVSDSKTNAETASDPVVAAALTGTSAAGVRLVPMAKLIQENPSLRQRLGSIDNRSGMVFESAYPLKLNDKLVGSVYGGIVLNNNNEIAERISQLLFKGEQYADKDVGSVTIYQGGEAISTTLKGPDGLPRVGSSADPKILDMVLNKGVKETTWVSQLGTTYLAAAEPISSPEGKIIGAVQVAIQEEPITMIIDRLISTFLLIGFLGVILMGAITYFLVTWINWPLQQMLNAARRAAEGDLSHEVPVIARDEVGELAATFNLMIRNLAESRNKLEAWGKELASKVAAQTGELAQAREQVARIKKLASLEKMADGVAHLMAHIADPMVGPPQSAEDESPTSRILVLDTDEKVLEVCQRILENEGLEVKLTRSVRETLDELESRFFDVVVAAVDMPEMSGTEFFKEIKYRQPEVLVILTAPFKDSEEAVETVKLGAFDYIPKPFGPHQILLMVYTALQTRQMLQRTRQEHAQRRAETIFQRVPVAIALADEAHRVVYNNKAFLELASVQGEEGVQGRTFNQIFGVDPLEVGEEKGGSRWLELHKVGRTAKLYTFELPEEDLTVLMLLDVTETVKKDQQADVLRAETLTRAQQVIHQQMRVAQEIAGLLGETTAETKAALFELIKLAGEEGETR